MQRSNNKRRGNVVVMTTVAMTTILGFSALAIDVGNLCMTKSELQRTADAAALAGAAGLISDNLLKANYDPRPDASVQIDTYALMNRSGGNGMIVSSNDIVIGHLDDPLDSTESLDLAMSTYNAVEVTVRRDAQHNGAVDTFFASILGIGSVDLEAKATAIIDDRFAGFANPNMFPGPFVPFAISETYYNTQLAGNVDNWSWNAGTGTPENVSDGIVEVWIYPEDNNSNGNGNGNGGNGGNSGGGGNFGSLNIGINNQGTSQLGDQIENGVTDAQLIDEIGTDTIMFFDSNGGSLTYSISGNPGISGGMTPYVEARIGDVIGFLIHDGVTDNGSNADFNIIGMRFGRLMEIDLTGNPSDKRIVIQPVVYNGPGIITDPAAASSGGMAYGLQLAR